MLEPNATCARRPGHKPVAIHGGDRTMLAVMDDGTLYCWRENGTGQCDADDWGTLYSYPVRVPRLPCVTKAVAGNNGVAMTADGRAFTWGIETSGERGDGDGPSPHPTQPTRIALGYVTDVAASGTAVGAIADGQPYWWGVTQEYAATPQRIGAPGVRKLAMDGAASCLLRWDGAVQCWGSAKDGALGPDGVDTNVPIAVPLELKSLDIGVADQTACVLGQDGFISCWGDNFLGTLGRGDSSDAYSELPAQIAATGEFSGLTVADGCACGWRPNGEVLCWGDNPVGLYAPFDGEPYGEPRRVREIEPAKQVALVYDEVCALGFDDVVRCRIPEKDPDAPQEARILDFENPAPEAER